MGARPTSRARSPSRSARGRRATPRRTSRGTSAIVFDKLAPLWRRHPGIALADLRRARAPTLVLAGDDDVLTVGHAAAMARALPDGQLAIVPGTSHALPMEKPELVNRLLLDFLADEQPPKMLVIS